MDTASLIGLLAAIGATLANVPQVMKTWRTSETGDLSLKMLAILTLSLSLWAIYGLLCGDFIIVGSNALSAAMAGYLTLAKLRHG